MRPKHTVNGQPLTILCAIVYAWRIHEGLGSSPQRHKKQSSPERNSGLLRSRY